MTDDLFGITASGWIGTKSNQYNIEPRLIVLSQAIGDKRISKFISSGWDLFKSLRMAQTVCHWQVAFFRQQKVQAGRLAQHTAPEEPLSQLSAPRLKRVLSSEYQHQCHRIVVVREYYFHRPPLYGLSDFVLAWWAQMPRRIRILKHRPYNCALEAQQVIYAAAVCRQVDKPSRYQVNSAWPSLRG